MGGEYTLTTQNNKKQTNNLPPPKKNHNNTHRKQTKQIKKAKTPNKCRKFISGFCGFHRESEISLALPEIERKFSHPSVC